MKNYIFSTLLFSIIFITACAAEKNSKPEVSLQTAKNLKIDKSSEIIKLPPKDVDSIIKRLSVQKYESINIGDLPKIEDYNKKLYFFIDRANYYFDIQEIPKALEDYKTAYKIMHKAKVYDTKAMLRYAKAEYFAGNLKNSLALINESLKKKIHGSTFRNLANLYYTIGDKENGDKYSDIGIESINNFLQNKKNIKMIAQEYSYMNLAVIQRDKAEENGELEKALTFSDDAIAATERVISLENKKNTITLKISAMLQKSKILSKLNRNIEAETIILTALNELETEELQSAHITAMTITMYAKMLEKRADFKNAVKLMELAKKIMINKDIEEHSSKHATVSLNLASLYFLSKDYKKAAELFQNTEKALIKNPLFKDILYKKYLAYPASLIKSGVIDKNSNLFDKYVSFAKLINGENSSEYYTSLAMHEINTKISYSEKDLIHSIDIIKKLSSKITKDDISPIKFAVVSSVLEEYAEHVYYHSDKNKLVQNNEYLSALFRLAEASRASSVEKSVNMNSARESAADPELKLIIRKTQDIGVRINDLETVLSDIITDPKDQIPYGIVAKTRSEIELLKSAKESLNKEIEQKFPKYDDFVSPKFTNPKEAAIHLYPDEILIYIHPMKTITLVWYISNNKTAMHIADIGEKDINLNTAEIKKSLNHSAEYLEDIPEYPFNNSYFLYEKLFMPKEDMLFDAKTAVVISKGSLGTIPLGALTYKPFDYKGDESLIFDGYRKAPWLINKLAFAYQPSVSNFVNIRKSETGKTYENKFIGFGDPIFNKTQEKELAKNANEKINSRGVKKFGTRSADISNRLSATIENLDRLPDTAKEIISIAETLGSTGDKNVYLNKRASEENVKSLNLSDREYILFSTHALLAGDLDGLDQPALALSSPTVTGNKEDGLLTMSEVMNLKLNAKLVVLSACNTGGTDAENNETVSGLGRAFFYAGSKSILATLWSVETTSAAKLVEYIFKDGANGAESLRSSMINIMNKEGFLNPVNGEMIAAYAHPYFWAPFILAGEPKTGGE